MRRGDTEVPEKGIDLSGKEIVIFQENEQPQIDKNTQQQHTFGILFRFFFERFFFFFRELGVLFQFRGAVCHDTGDPEPDSPGENRGADMHQQQLPAVYPIKDIACRQQDGPAVFFRDDKINKADRGNKDKE